MKIIAATLLAIVGIVGCHHRRSVVVLESASGDFGQQLTDAINSCAPGACFIDARQITGAQTSAQNIVITRALTTIQVAFSSLTMAPNTNIQLGANYITFGGPSMVSSTIRCQSNAVPCVYIGTSNTSGIYGVVLHDLGITPVRNTTSVAGIRIQNARGPGALLARLSVDGFSSSTALQVLENCWTWDVRDSQFVNSGHGIEILGDQANAWVFTHNLINTNVNEGVFMRLCDYPTTYGGCTSNGIFFENGNHFEGNGKAGIRLVNGSFYNLDIRDSYAELTKVQTGYFQAENDGNPNTQLRVSGMLVDGGGGYVSGGTPLNVIDGTKGYDYGAAPVPIESIYCSGGNCTVVTSQPHGFTCSTVNNYSLCPYVHLKGVNEGILKITGIQTPTQFTFFLNGSRSGTKGFVSYEPDLVNITISNQKWDSSWTAPTMISSAGTGVTVTAHDNSVLDGKGILNAVNRKR